MATAPRGDRRGSAPNVYGKTDVSYPDADRTKPTIVVRGTKRQSKVAPTFLDAHPDTGTYPLCKKTEDRSEIGDNHDVNSVEVFETLPGAELTSYVLSTGGKMKRTRRKKVALPTLPATSDYTISNRVEALSKVKGLQIIEDWVDADGSTQSSATIPFTRHAQTIEPEGVQLVTWVKTVPAGTEAYPVGQTYIITAGDMASGGTYPGRRRIPTFPTGITNAGTWENAQSYVVHSETRDIEDSPNKTLIVQTCPLPRTRYLFPRLSHQFPALFSYDVTSNLLITNGRVALSSAITYKGHRTRRVVACELFKYSVGPTSALSDLFTIDSPGAASTFLSMLDENTIYGDPNAAHAATVFSIYSGATLIESFAQASVTGCAGVAGAAMGKGALPTYYRIGAEQDIWKGDLWYRKYLVVREEGDIVGEANSGRFNSTSDNSTGTYLYCV